MKKTTAHLGRIHELDLLRGFFILVIVVDHFQRWPSAFTYITGEGRLWVSAAEGLFIISGLLIGYLRGHKQRDLPLSTIAKGLAKRAAMLYVWAVGITFAVVAMSAWFAAGDPLVPSGPNVEQTASIGAYVWNVFTQSYSSDWIFFLRLYAIMLLASPFFIWLLRKGKWWVAAIISLLVYWLSFLFEQPEAAMQWQVLFFGAGLIGYKLDTIRQWLSTHTKARRIISVSVITTAITTMILSYFWVLGWNYVESPNSSISRDTYVAARNWLDPLFGRNPMMPFRIILSFIWAAGLFAIFHYGRAFIMKWLGWLLILFGQRSLSAYCLQALFLMPVQFLVPVFTSFWLNTLLTTGIVLVFWALLRLPLVQRYLPK